MRETESIKIVCPNCGEPIAVEVDVMERDCPERIEDCTVCCRPMILRIQMDEGNKPHVTAESESE